MNDYILKVSTTFPMEKVIGLVASKHTKVRWIKEIEKKYSPQTFAMPFEDRRFEAAKEALT